MAGVSRGFGLLAGKAFSDLLVAATAAYLFGVRLPTIAINVSLNHGLESLDAPPGMMRPS